MQDGEDSPASLECGSDHPEAGVVDDDSGLGLFRVGFGGPLAEEGVGGANAVEDGGGAAGSGGRKRRRENGIGVVVEAEMVDVFKGGASENRG